MSKRVAPRGVCVTFLAPEAKKKSEVCLNKDADLAMSESNKCEYVSICLPALG